MISTLVATCNPMEFLLDLSNGFVPWEHHQHRQQSFKGEGHLSHGSTHCCFPYVFCIADVIKKTTVGKKNIVLWIMFVLR